MRKKPRLRLLKSDNLGVANIARLYENLTGKVMSKEELDYARKKLRDSQD